MQERQVTETVDQEILESGGFQLINQETTETVSVVNTEAQTASEAQNQEESVEHEHWIETPEGEVIETLEDAFHYLRQRNASVDE